MDENVLLALGLTLMAGLATGIGSLMGFFTSTTNTKFLSLSLGFSAGVMIYVSMVEIFIKAKDALTGAMGIQAGNWATVGGFFGGMLLIALIDKLIPKQSNPHEGKKVEEMDNPAQNQALLKMGTFTALAIAIHNFPEGIATFTSALQDPSLGIAIAIAIAIHNIPEGIAVAVPVYFATGNKKKAFGLSFLSGLSEPVGAVLAYLVLMPFLNDIMFGVIFAAVAGIMVFISLDGLLPAAKKYDEGHTSIYGLISGMMVMAVSLLLFI
ncbi:zinc transporter ZupT [Terribacillus saccharophilus]|uniref:Zinc transporter ZupT n=1 Tax=Terribacillus saccharophilus TaxID=361277 RepID=A0A075LNN8_9BACI|nr:MULTISPECIES: zinc transporter ZupT [Terribacillus]AIF67721.1 zinc transporter ZupT [Terribacillus goriensis]MCM3225492.1 zinc transporter ZupT [Terribacillus saccharophilus]MEC0281793.1 zinc transporter ZupT [Terribacillus saccharophilus]MEC0291418.1 zinc transporter ZupT [Terribacillus saccharophilus]MEC0302620.1 zinc transporter ZupT [Terribacillus saccharophilus]